VDSGGMPIHFDPRLEGRVEPVVRASHVAA
jgi:hypothetical protein